MNRARNCGTSNDKPSNTEHLEHRRQLPYFKTVTSLIDRNQPRIESSARFEAEYRFGSEMNGAIGDAGSESGNFLTHELRGKCAVITSNTSAILTVTKLSP